MINSIEEYLLKLKKELSGRDPDIVRDALSDSEEHLREALVNARTIQPKRSESGALQEIIANYGTPGEIAATYREIEARRNAAGHRRKTPVNLVVSLSFLLLSAYFLCHVIFYLYWLDMTPNRLDRIGGLYITFASGYLIATLVCGVVAYYLWKYSRKSEKDLPLVLGLIPVAVSLMHNIVYVYILVQETSSIFDSVLIAIIFILFLAITPGMLIMLIVAWGKSPQKKKGMQTMKCGTSRC